MSKESLITPGAAPVLGPLCHATRANGFVFTSGQCPLAADGSGKIDGTIEDETRMVLDNLKAVLEGAGSSLDKVMKATVFLVDLENFAAVNAVYAEYFPNDPPARSCIQVAKLPFESQVEIEAIALA